MTATVAKTLTLAEFLNLPSLEESPAWKYVNGVAMQKPMPKTRHSILQKRLLREIDDRSDDYTALPKLRYTFGGRSLVPDIVVVSWDRIKLNEAEEPEDNFLEAPDWSIEILSPDKNANRVIDNILHCLGHGSQLGWTIDPDDYSVLIFAPQQEPNPCRGSQQLRVLAGIDMRLTAEQVFGWLKVDRSRV